MVCNDVLKSKKFAAKSGIKNIIVPNPKDNIAVIRRNVDRFILYLSYKNNKKGGN